MKSLIKILKTAQEMRKERLNNEQKKNILNRYCRKVEYYEEMGYDSRIAQIKAKKQFGFIK